MGAGACTGKKLVEKPADTAKDSLVPNRFKVVGVLLFLGVAVLGGAKVGFAADQTKTSKQPVQEPKPVKTDLANGAYLSPSEVRQVVALAKKCGIADVGEVSTFHYLPVGGKGISVKSTERVDGRNVSYDRVEVHKTGWNSSTASSNKVKRDGNFWCNVGGKYTTLFRSYEFKTRTIKIQIGKGVDIALDDQIIGLFVQNKVQVDNDFNRRQFDELWITKPEGLFQRDSKRGYELRFEGYPVRSLLLEMENGRLVVTGVMHTVF